MLSLICAYMFSLIFAWCKQWRCRYLRPHRAHYDVTQMKGNEDEGTSQAKLGTHKSYHLTNLMDKPLGVFFSSLRDLTLL